MSESRTGFARRIDAHLRAHYPNLVTRLFEVTQDQFLITFPAEQQLAEAISDTFDRNIRFVTVGVQLSNSPPTVFLHELSPLSDAEAAGDYVGLPLNTTGFNTLVAARFPDAPFLGVEEDFDNRVFGILLSEPVGEAEASKIVAFADSLGLPFTSEVRVRSPEATPSKAAQRAISSPAPEDDPLRIRASRHRTAAPGFVKRDEAFWFEQLGAAARGNLPLERFPGVTAESFRCFMDFSVGEHLNLRQALLLYDEVYCSLPLADQHETFLAQQALSESDLLAAVDAGRLKVISTQPEERLKTRFLEAVAERRPDAIMGRRAASLLLISDMAQTAELYRLRNPTYYPALRDLSEIFGPNLGLTPDSWLRLLLWPLAARRLGLGGLLDEGTKRGPALFLAQGLADAIRKVGGQDVRLEALVLSERVHIGHALKATVIPPLSEPEGLVLLMEAIGHELNFFKNFNVAHAAAWAANENRRANRVSIVPAIPLLSFDAKVPMQEILEESELGSVRGQGRALMNRLAELPVEARADEIDALADRHRRTAQRNAERVISFDTLDTGFAAASIIASFVCPPVMGLYHLGGKLIDRLRRVPAVDRFVADFQADWAELRGGNEDLEFLSRISRIARLKRDTV